LLAMTASSLRVDQPAGAADPPAMKRLPMRHAVIASVAKQSRARRTQSIEIASSLRSSQ
jgi:hypothetical protein